MQTSAADAVAIVVSLIFMGTMITVFTAKFQKWLDEIERSNRESKKGE